MRIFDGKKVSRVILSYLKKEIRLRKANPSLAVILVGYNPESELYIRNKEKAAMEVGINFFLFHFKKDISERIIIKRIKELNKDNLINGVIVQLPLPKGIDTNKVISAVAPEKDVDGFHKVNRRLLKKGEPLFLPVLPSAIDIALQKVPANLKEKGILIVANSDIFAETIKDFFDREGIKTDVIIKEKCSLPYIRKRMKEADVIISVCGEPGYIKGTFVKKEVALVDAGIRVIQGKVKGDVDKKSVWNKASFLTPVPGGIGPLTVALLLNNVYLASQRNK